jgi:hypothetical protein
MRNAPEVQSIYSLLFTLINPTPFFEHLWQNYLEITPQAAQIHAQAERHEIPTCYYEFARRYPLADGRLYQGFVAASADRIFESTHRIQ